MLITKTLTRKLLLSSSVVTNRARIVAATPKQAFYISHSASQRNAFIMATAGEAPKDTKEPCPVKEELPKLSDHEFRVYNRLADKMNWFVCCTPATLDLHHKTHHFYKRRLTHIISAQQLPPILERPLAGLHHRPPPPRHVPQAALPHRHRIRRAPHRAPPH